MENMFTVPEAAKYLGLKPQTLNNRRNKGLSPKYVKYSGRAVRYRQTDLDAYIIKHTVTPYNEKKE